MWSVLSADAPHQDVSAYGELCPHSCISEDGASMWVLGRVCSFVLCPIHKSERSDSSRSCLRVLRGSVWFPRTSVRSLITLHHALGTSSRVWPGAVPACESAVRLAPGFWLRWQLSESPSFCLPVTKRVWRVPFSCRMPR